MPANYYPTAEHAIKHLLIAGGIGRLAWSNWFQRWACPPGVRAAHWSGETQDTQGGHLRVMIIQQSCETRTLLEAVVARAGAAERDGVALLLSPVLAGSLARPLPSTLFPCKWVVTQHQSTERKANHSHRQPNA